MSAEIKTEIRNFIVTHSGVGMETISDETKLISSRLIDSIVALRLVAFLEEKFQIEFEAHEVNQDNLETIDTIAAFVSSKMK